MNVSVKLFYIIDELLYSQIKLFFFFESKLNTFKQKGNDSTNFLFFFEYFHLFALICLTFCTPYIVVSLKLMRKCIQETFFGSIGSQEAYVNLSVTNYQCFGPHICPD